MQVTFLIFKSNFGVVAQGALVLVMVGVSPPGAAHTIPMFGIAIRVKAITSRCRRRYTMELVPKII